MRRFIECRLNQSHGRTSTTPSKQPGGAASSSTSHSRLPGPGASDSVRSPTQAAEQSQAQLRVTSRPSLRPSVRPSDGRTRRRRCSAPLQNGDRRRNASAKKESGPRRCSSSPNCNDAPLQYHSLCSPPPSITSLGQHNAPLSPIGPKYPFLLASRLFSPWPA